MFFLFKLSISLTRHFAVLSFLSPCHAGLVLFFRGERVFLVLRDPTVQIFKTNRSLLRFFKKCFNQQTDIFFLCWKRSCNYQGNFISNGMYVLRVGGEVCRHLSGRL